MGRKLYPNTPGVIKPYVYPKKRKFPEVKKAPALQATRDGEILTGFIGDMEASDLEEYFAIALKTLGNVDGFEFRVPTIAGRNMPGEVEVDFMVYYAGGLMQPIQMDGEFTHKTAEQRQRDNDNDAKLNDSLFGTGAMPVLRIRVPQDMTADFESAKELAGRLFG